MTSEEQYARTLDYLRQRKAAYQTVFGSQGGQAVIDDLKRFCRARTSCFHRDERTHAALEGRREVWLRIEDHLNLPVEDLAQLYGAVAPSTGDRDDD